MDGQAACAKYLQNSVEELLVDPAELDQTAQTTLLAELDEDFTEDNNEMLTAEPTKAEVEESVKSSDTNAAPGRAELIAKTNLLKSTKWKHYSLHNSALLLDEAINLHFV